MLAEENFALKLRLQELLPLLSSPHQPQRPPPPTTSDDTPPKKKQRGVTNPYNLKAALLEHLVGGGGVKLSQRKCCEKFSGVSKPQLGNHAKQLSDQVKASP